MSRRTETRKPIPRHPGLYKRGDSYQFRVQFHGKRSWVTIPGGDIGVQAAAQYRNRYLGRQAPAPTNVTFLEYANEWMASRQLKPRTRERYELHIQQHLKSLHHRKLSSITTDDVRALITEMRAKGLAAGTIRSALGPLSAMFSTLVADRRVEHNPVKQLEVGTIPSGRRSKKVIISAEQARAMLEKAPSLTWKTYLALGLYAGLRQSEALGLTWDCVDLEAREIRVEKQMGRDRELASLKGREEASKERVVEMPDVLRKILLEQRLATGGRGLVVCTKGGGPINHRNATRMFDNVKPDPELTFHQLRHNFASALIGAGADVVYVSHQLGHSSPSITMDVYAHQFKAVRERGSAAAAIDAAFGEAAL